MRAVVAVAVVVVDMVVLLGVCGNELVVVAAVYRVLLGWAWV